MPVVTLQMFPGRSAVIKELMARALVDSVAEIGGMPRESVHVIIDDVAPENWAIGPRLAASRNTPPPSPDAPAYVTIGHVCVEGGKGDSYLAWRSDALLPSMGSCEGFISSVILGMPDEPDRYTVITKWVSIDLREAFWGSARGTELAIEERDFLSVSALASECGLSVDVFRHTR